MKAIKTDSLFLKELYDILRDKVEKKEYNGQLPTTSLVNAIYDTNTAITRKLNKVIFGSNPPNINYLTQRQSDANKNSKGVTSFNIEYLINIFSYIDIRLSSASIRGAEKKVIALANEFIKTYLPDKKLLESDDTEIRVKDKSKGVSLYGYDKMYRGTVNQGGEIDSCEFIYSLKNKVDLSGKMIMTYQAGGVKDVYPVEVEIYGKVFDNKFSLVYYGRLNPENQCGVIFLELNKTKLEGNFLGYFRNIPKNRKECKGTVNLTLVKK